MADDIFIGKAVEGSYPEEGLKFAVKGIQDGDFRLIRNQQVVVMLKSRYDALTGDSEAPEGSEVEKYRNHEKVLTDLLAHARDMAAFHEEDGKHGNYLVDINPNRVISSTEHGEIVVWAEEGGDEPPGPFRPPHRPTDTEVS